MDENNLSFSMSQSITEECAYIGAVATLARGFSDTFTV